MGNENERMRNASASVGTTAVIVSPKLQYGQRKAIVITNTSTGGQIITLSWENQAQSNIGVVLYPAGSWSESLDSAFVPSNTEIWAISSAASGTIAIHERVIN